MEQTLIKKIGSFLLGLVILSGIGYLGWQLVELLWGTFSDLDKSILAALITGTLVASGAIWVKHLEHRHSVEAEFRNQKIQHFDDFLQILEDMGSDENDAAKLEDAVTRLKDWKRVGQLWGGPQLVRSFYAITTNANSNPETLGEFAKMVEPIGELFLSMRRDLGLSNRGIVPRKYGDSVSKATMLGVYWQLRHPHVFLDHLRADPDMTMEQYQKIEARAGRDAGIS